MISDLPKIIKLQNGTLESNQGLQGITMGFYLAHSSPILPIPTYPTRRGYALKRESPWVSLPGKGDPTVEKIFCMSCQGVWKMIRYRSSEACCLSLLGLLGS